MSRVHRWLGTVEELTDTHAYVVMRVTPDRTGEMWVIPLRRMPEGLLLGHVVEIRVCPRKVKVSLVQRDGKKR